MTAKKKTIQERKEQLLNQLQEIKEAEKKQENDRFIIIGRIIDEECLKNNELKGTLESLLKSNLNKNSERLLFDLPELPKKQKLKGMLTHT